MRGLQGKVAVITGAAGGIGRELVRRGIYRPEEVSMQSIRRWLDLHPGEADALLDVDASYVFFDEVKGEGPLGAEGVVLTPGRSLAVDRQHWPLGVPLWLDVMAPAPRETDPEQPLRRLFLAQDTGGAIQGAVRADLFWGWGEDAALLAGRTKQPLRLWALLPIEGRWAAPEALEPPRGAGEALPRPGGTSSVTPKP